MIDFKRYSKSATAETIESFKEEAFRELDLEDNSESNELFQKAWRYAFRCGFEEVFEHLKDLVGIIRENDKDF